MNHTSIFYDTDWYIKYWYAIILRTIIEIPAILLNPPIIYFTVKTGLIEGSYKWLIGGTCLGGFVTTVLSGYHHIN